MHPKTYVYNLYMYNMHIHKYIRIYMCTYMYIERERGREIVLGSIAFSYIFIMSEKSRISCDVLSKRAPQTTS